MEIWLSGFTTLAETAARAAWAEAGGFDGMLLVDSQCLAADPYVGLTLAALATDRLRLATGVTNTFTRDVSVTATAIQTVHEVSRGRAVLGVGRGDSALAHLGMAPIAPERFEADLVRLHAYLDGQEVEFQPTPEGVAPVTSLRMANPPSGSRLRWNFDRFGKVPVDVFASGPRMLAIGGRRGDRVTVSVGADLERVTWAVAQVRAAAASFGRDPSSLPVGAAISVIPHADREVGRQMAAGALASRARFAVMHGTPHGPMNADDAAVLRRVHSSYDMSGHAHGNTPQSAVLTPEFIDRNAVLGSSAECTDHLVRLAGLGISHVQFSGASPGADPVETAAVSQSLVEEVIPAFKERAGAAAS